MKKTTKEERAEAKKAATARWIAEHPEQHKAVSAKWREENRDYLRAKARKNYYDNIERYREHDKAYNKLRAESRREDDSKRHAERRKNPEHYVREKMKRAELKEEIIAAYGGECACCGEDRQAFLTIDHIVPTTVKNRMRSGTEHSQSVGQRLYGWLRRYGFPKDNYRLLCYNCNIGRKKGPCPHEVERSRASMKIVFE